MSAEHIGKHCNIWKHKEAKKARRGGRGDTGSTRTINLPPICDIFPAKPRYSAGGTTLTQLSYGTHHVIYPLQLTVSRGQSIL